MEGRNKRFQRQHSPYLTLNKEIAQVHYLFFLHGDQIQSATTASVTPMKLAGFIPLTFACVKFAHLIRETKINAFTNKNLESKYKLYI